jgi:hypothetical protein
MQSAKILWRGVIRKSDMPRNFPRLRNEVQRSRGQRRHVQRLADVASRIRPAGVMMQNGAASREIQQRYATQYRQRASAR